ncbi:hypothetical protein L1049_000626 [Liquidambar formosana]|uniref:Nudix hydrolase domain-containing protein n=1 Tax=Liquidambar formosana TaxID=63359 RepID=A0AAP0R7V2_LIQFO
MDQEVIENGCQQVEPLSAYNDDHGGVIVEMTEPMDPKVFDVVLGISLSQWRQQGKRGVWIKLPIELVNLVETAVKAGFKYHHAEPTYLMLVYWIPETASSIPANASHRLLVVQEKSGRLKGMGVWKIPTGVVEQGEDIFKTAVREVKEETGIEAEFMEVLAFRQSHKLFFGKSDLLFVCLLRPLSFDIQKQESEIEAAQWMPFEEYAAQPFVQKHEPYKYITDICLAKVDKHYAGFSPVPVTSFFGDQLSYFYLNSQDLNQQNSTYHPTPPAKKNKKNK